ncbi:DUF4189 domain-containing protein [Xanthomonas sp. XNM01]|uniref:DUF4189 domain-containing protein n=1 Tax=Xanthomonas sp. XNM01 TaxID=2769289 RepID=UPI001781CC1F|nr:DUF4189 domain-containing protein [Xanthomonas sp. XNM01]MBD9367324.1 DUF4189 domain-containing protein [Xanthomonas sp. XNM01]
MNTVSKAALAVAAAALLLAGGSAPAQNGAQARMQAHAAQMNFLGWQQSQQAANYISAEEAAAQQAAAAAARAAAQRVRDDAKRDWWGGVVVNTDDGSWNVRLNMHSHEEALRLALEECKGTCWPVLSFANSCVAPAYSQQGGMYFNNGESKDKARDAALATCTTAGGEQCHSPAEQSFCTGWKFAYSAIDRLSYRLELIAINRVAKPKLDFFPGAAEFVAKPPAARGTSTAMPTNAVHGDRGKVARFWTAVAVEREGDAIGMHLGVNETDASDTARSKCGQRSCEVVLAWPAGECGALVQLRGADRRTVTYTATGKTADEAEETAVTECIENGEKICPVMFKQCA